MNRTMRSRRGAETRRRSGVLFFGRVQSARKVLINFVRYGRAALAEIFDESAYARFLSRKGLPSSRSAYAAFLREKFGGRPRPRCC